MTFEQIKAYRLFAGMAGIDPNPKYDVFDVEAKEDGVLVITPSIGPSLSDQIRRIVRDELGRGV